MDGLGRGRWDGFSGGTKKKESEEAKSWVPAGENKGAGWTGGSQTALLWGRPPNPTTPTRLVGFYWTPRQDAPGI